MFFESPFLRHNIVQSEPFALSCGEGDSYKAVFKFRIPWSSLLTYCVLVCNYQVDFYIDFILTLFCALCQVIKI